MLSLRLEWGNSSQTLQRLALEQTTSFIARRETNPDRHWRPRSPPTSLFSGDVTVILETLSLSVKCKPKIALLLFAAALANLGHLFDLSLQHGCGRNKALGLQSPWNTTLSSDCKRRKQNIWILTVTQIWQCTKEEENPTQSTANPPKQRRLAKKVFRGIRQPPGRSARVLGQVVDSFCHASLVRCQGMASESRANPPWTGTAGLQLEEK